MSLYNLEILAHMFVFSRLDYFTGSCSMWIRQVQLIQNIAFKILTTTRIVDHIAPVLRC